jgi:hypothetical protein
MKPLRFLPITIILFFQFSANSQQISNSSFENWTSILHFENPELYNSSNVFSYYTIGEANVTKSSDAQSGNFALHLETVETIEEILAGAVFIGDVQGENITGGLPFSEKPDSLKGFAKFNIMENDTAYVAVIFKKFGSPIGVCYAQFYGTQDTWEEFSVPAIWPVPIISPDTIAVGILSSTIFSEPVPGSTLTIDNISFVGATSPFPNGDFENWIEFASEEPDDWFTSNVLSLAMGEASVTKTTDSYEGTYAVKIENQLNFYEDTLGFITNGTMGEDNPIGGMPIDSTPDKVSGYYKYTPVGPDTAVGGLFLYYYNENTGETELLEEAFVILPAVNDYTYFEIELDYFSLPEPDTLNIAFASGNVIEDTSFVGLGSELYIDVLEITYKPHIVGLNNPEAKHSHRIYPNPASDIVYFEFKEVLSNEIVVSISDLHGKLVHKQKFNPLSVKQFDISVEDFTPGLYLYQIESGNNSYSGKVIIR